MIESLEQRMLFTVLTFEPATGTWANYTPVPQTYGDRVTAATQGGFKYGTAGGTTPNVVAAYGSTATTGHVAGTIVTWDANYGDLSHNAFSNPSGSIFQITLTADTAYNVQLASFDMAGWSRADYTINSVKVTNGSGAVLYSASNVKIEGNAVGAAHSHFTFASTVKSPVLKITFDSSNSGGYDVGMDNVQFSQVKVGPTAGTVSGNVFTDANANGKKDLAELGLAGWRVFDDVNNNGMWDSNEASTLTDASGNYKLSLAGGTHILGVQLKRGYYQTSPHALVYNISINGNNLIGDVFGVKTIAPV
jgi:hypothetical protein